MPTRGQRHVCKPFDQNRYIQNNRLPPYTYLHAPYYTSLKRIFMHQKSNQKSANGC